MTARVPLPRNAPSRRRIGADRFAFLRAVVLGLPLREAADRYLGDQTDLRAVQSELRWLRTELLAAARRAGAFGDARALQLDIALLPQSARDLDPKGSAPSLEEFRGRVDPDGFYGEAELLDLYRHQYPPPPAASRPARLARLRERQRRALETLERVLVEPPSLDDPPSAWLEPATARRIEAVGIPTLRALADQIQRRGNRWCDLVPKVGPVAAGRVVVWFERNAEPLGTRVGGAPNASRTELVAAWKALPASGHRPAPLERLAVPSNFDGSSGTNRLQGVRQKLDAQNDRDAIEAWLAARAGGNANTMRTYRREAERLLLWALFERKRAMSSLTVDDAIAYRAFLADPQPADRWVGTKAELRLSPNWRPFTGALSARSVQFAIVVLKGLFDWLTRQHYLAHNIWDALPRNETLGAAAQADLDTLALDSGRFFTPSQWAVVRDVLKSLGQDQRSLRVRFAVALGYSTGLRISELVDARIGRLGARLADDDGTERFVVLRVLGKGGKPREVPIAPPLEELLDEYLYARGLDSWFECQRAGMNGVRLIGHLTQRYAPDQPVAAHTLHREVKAVFGKAADVLERRGLMADAAQFRRASTHWLRHTFGRHSLGSGVNLGLNVVQAILGHASIATTTRYTSQTGDEAFRGVAKLARKGL